MMACDPAALMDQDTWLAAVLTSRPTVSAGWRHDDAHRRGHGHHVRVPRPSAPSRSRGRPGCVEAIVDGDAVSSIAGRRAAARCWSSTAPTSPSFAGCNTGSGSYTVEGADDHVRSARHDARSPARATARWSSRPCSPCSPARRRSRSRATSSPCTNGTDGLVLRGPRPRAAPRPRGSRVCRGCSTRSSTPTRPARSPAGVRQPTLEFDGTDVAVDTGCNTGSAGYTVDGDQITFGPMAMTLDRMCRA